MHKREKTKPGQRSAAGAAGISELAPSLLVLLLVVFPAINLIGLACGAATLCLSARQCATRASTAHSVDDATLTDSGLTDTTIAVVISVSNRPIYTPLKSPSMRSIRAFRRRSTRPALAACWAPGAATVDADGESGMTDGAGVPRAALVGQVGNGPRFFVGKDQWNFTPPSTGRLKLQFNDWDDGTCTTTWTASDCTQMSSTRSPWEDNSGLQKVKIYRTNRGRYALYM